MDIVLYILSGVAVVVGIVGVVLPAIPGTPLVFVGLLLAAWVGHFEVVSVPTVVALGMLATVSLLVDFIAGAIGAKKVGASRYALIGAFIGTIVGLAGGFMGIIFGPFIGAALGELYATQDLVKAGKVGIATWIGLLVGTAIKLGIIFTMLGVFVTALII